MSKTVLIVEDERLIAMDLRSRLVSLGYEVSAIAATGAQALAEVESTPPDLILMDIRLKGPMDGLEAAAAIRERYSIPLIFLTAHSDRQTFDGALASEPAAFLSKPYSERDLDYAIQIALGRAEKERQNRPEGRILAEETLRSIPFPLVAVDASGQVQFVNAAAALLTGSGSGAAVGRSVSELLGPETALAVADAGGAVPFGRGENRYTIQKASLRGGQKAWLGPGREPHELLIFHPVAPAGPSAPQATEPERFETSRRIAAAVAHDLNNQLLVILGTAEMMSGAAPETSSRSLRAIRASAERLHSVSRELTALSGNQPARPESLDLAQVIEGVLPELQAIAGDGIDVSFHCPAPDCRAVADRAGLIEALVHLVRNSTDAQPGGGEIRIEIRPALLASRREANAVVVSDRGTGIPDEIRSLVLDPYFTTRRSQGNRGVGLAIVSAFVRQMQGTLNISGGIPGSGTAVEMIFPAPQSSASKSSQVRAGARDGGAILLVEDEPELCRVLSDFLTGQGVEVCAHTSGQKALEAFRASPDRFNVLVTDVLLGGMDGRELYSRISETHPSLPAVFMSGYVPDGFPLETWPEGALFLQKPFPLASLAASIETVLGFPGD